MRSKLFEPHDHNYHNTAVLQVRPLHDCKWDKYVVGKTSPKRRRQTNRLRKETEWSTLFSRVSAGRSERPSLRVAKNVQQFVQGIRGAVRPLLKLRGTNSSPGARPSVPSPRLLLMRENLSKSGAHVWRGRTSPQIWVIFEWVLIGGCFL